MKRGVRQSVGSRKDQERRPGACLIVILGCAVHPGGVPSPALRRRVLLAIQTADGQDALFMPVGGLGRHAPAEARMMQQLLVEAGVAARAIVPVPEGNNTIASLRACWPVLRRELARAPRSVYVCTDDYHLRRCRLILRVWGLESRAGARGGPAPGAAKAWMIARDHIALVKDLTIALGWRVTRRLHAPRA